MNPVNPAAGAPTCAVHALDDIWEFFESNGELEFIFYARDNVQDDAVDGFGPDEAAARRLLQHLQQPNVVDSSAGAHPQGSGRERYLETWQEVATRLLELRSRPAMEFILAWWLPGDARPRLDYSRGLSRPAALAELEDLVDFPGPRRHP